MRLGVLGGTFDPIHYAHLVIAEEARVRLHLDRVCSYLAAIHRTNWRRPLASDEHRLAMVQLAIASNSAF